MIRFINILTVILFAFTVSGQDTYYVATDGSDDTGDGSISNPWASWRYGAWQLEDGDTLYIRGGVYYPQSRVAEYVAGAFIIDSTRGLGSGGSVDAWKRIFAYPGESPILDCSQMDNYSQNYNIGFKINYAEFLHMRGLTIRNVFQQDEDALAPEAYGVSWSRSANLTFENITVHDIGGRGYWGQGGAWTPADSAYAVDSTGSTPESARIYCAYDTTMFINCDTYNVCDSIDYTGSGDPGNSADCWKTVHYGGNYVVWKNCRAWNYTDDGWDPSLACRSGDGPTVIMDNCWAMASTKYLEYCNENAAEGKEGIEANGIKFGTATGTGKPETPSVYHFNCIAMFCLNAGFLSNIEINGVDKFDAKHRYYNCSAYYNKYGWDGQNIDMLERDMIVRNSLSWGDDICSRWQDLTKIYYPSVYTESHNTWDASQRDDVGSYSDPWEFTDTVTISDADFTSLDSLTLVAAFTAPRGENNELPTNPLSLVSSSDLIDAGTLVPHSDSLWYYLEGTDYENWQPVYSGTAPDIGAFEYTGASPSGRRPAIGRNGGFTIDRNGNPMIFEE